MEDGTWDATVDGEPIAAADFKLDDLVGSKLTRRRTLEKYLSSDPTIEFPKDVYIIDRIQQKTNLLFGASGDELILLSQLQEKTEKWSCENAPNERFSKWKSLALEL